MSSDTELSWYVYLLECENGSLYCGVAKDPQKRLAAHIAGKGARYTKIHKPLQMLHCEGPYSQGDALRREIAIKKLPRNAKLTLSQTTSSKS